MRVHWYKATMKNGTVFRIGVHRRMKAPRELRWDCAKLEYIKSTTIGEG